MISLKDTRLAVFGPGLLGGSLLHDARALHAKEVRVWARRLPRLDEIRAMNLADFTSIDAKDVAKGADILVLCVPVGGMAALAESLVSSEPAEDAIFTDVGSVKGMVMREVAPIFAKRGFTFIGSHPMAGSEKTGLKNSRAGLYQNAACILTPIAGEDRNALKLLSEFWETLGCRVSQMDASQHDEVVARVSHLPHIVAALASIVALRKKPDHGQYAAGGLRDTTRVASGDPAMWREILLENREALLPALLDLRNEADSMIEFLENSNSDQITNLLNEARNLRARHYS